MKSQLNRYRQYTISDYLLNINKFKEYLQFCQKNNLKKEKKYIMENLFRTLKENIANQKSLSELKKLCVLSIIFSDFEIELLFDLEYFNPDIQKKIFIEIQNYLDKNNDMDNIEEIKQYIDSKFNFWRLKLQNQSFQNFIGLNVEEKEVKESVEKLSNYINIEKSIYKGKKKNEKSFILKIIYELALFYYFKDLNENTNKYLDLLINYYNDYIEEYKININSKEHKLFYFDIEKVKYLCSYNKNNKKDKNEYREANNNLNDNFIIVENLDNYDNIINEDYNKYKNEIEKTKTNYKDQLILSNENALNGCELSNKSCVSSLLNCLKITENLIDLTLENYNYFQIGKNFLNSLKNKADFKLKNNNNKKDDKDLQYIIKEITYYNYMVELIEKMINNEEKLRKKFFTDLSEYIISNTLTGNLKLSGLIHSNMINFSNNLKTLNSYFLGFINMVNDKTMVYKKETINQITFISKIVQIFYTISDEKTKVIFPLDKDIIINIPKDLHIELINIFLFWLSSDDTQNEDNKKKDIKKTKKNLKYNPSINIIYILIESLKNLDFLKMLRIIISNVLEFVINKMHLNEERNFSDLFEYIYEIKPKLFKINNLLDGVLRNMKVIVNDSTYFINFKINFNESTNRDQYKYKIDSLNFYIKTLFQLLKKINKKIYKYESIEKINKLSKVNKLINDNNNSIIINNNNINSNEIIEQDNNYFDEFYNNKKNKFLVSFYYIIEINSIKTDREIKAVIINGINFLQFSMSNFKVEYMRNDLLNDISKVQKLFEQFKSLINQDILFQIILCFIKQKRFLEGIILIQYIKKFDTAVLYNLLQNACEKNDFINIESFKYIWKMIIFEYLSNFFYKNNNYDALAKIKALVKRVSNHQFFKGHPLRKNFKIVNFFNFLDYLNNIKYNF